MIQRNRARLICFACLCLVAMLFMPTGHLVVRANDPSPAALLERAWRNAEEAGSYRFVSDIDQRLVPRPTAAMMGQGDTSLNLALDGAVVLPDQAYSELRVQGGAGSAAVTLLQDGGQSFLLQDGEVKPVESAINLTGQSNDLLAYLAGAEYVTLLNPPEGHPQLVRYGFTISGPAYAEHVRLEAEAALRAQPGAPEGLTVKPMPVLQQLTGRGELWVNAAGLPVRQVLELTMPEVSEGYDAHVRMVTDLSGYGQVEGLPRAVQGPDGTWRLEGSLPPGAGTRLGAFAGFGALPPGQDPGEPAPPAGPIAWWARASAAMPLQVSPTGAMIALVLLVGLVLVRFYRRDRRRCYALIVLVLVPTMVLSPVLQAAGVVHFIERQVQAAEARAAALPELIRGLGLEMRDSVETGAAQAPAIAAADRMAADLTALQTLGDPSRLSRCGQGDEGVDTDGDGLSDQVELCLGTNPYDPDTDRDGIPDGVEVTGFEYDGHTWTSDPLKADSSGDGVGDMMGYPPDVAPYGQATEIDTDGDGIPNLWDDDIDNDGVPNGLDLSPQGTTELMTELDLSISGEGPQGYRYVELHIRPENPDHLRYSTTALDWPFDEQGNVQDLDNSPGDLRMTPFLLLTADVPPSQELEAKYGYRSWETDGAYTVLVPLLPLENNGAIHAYYAKVVYGPETTGAVGLQGKMVWMTLMDVDSWVHKRTYWGTETSMATETMILHQYTDRFSITGLDVTVNQGYEALVLATPATMVDGQPDDVDLFKLLLGLNTTFRTHMRMENQGDNETALQEIAGRFGDASTANITHTFGVAPEYVAVAGPAQYSHLDAGLAGVGSELVPSFFDHYGGLYLNACKDASGAAVSCGTMVVAYEQTTGGHDLTDLSITSEGDTVSLYANAANIGMVTLRGVQMRMYEQGPGGWQMTTPARFLELAEGRYRDRYGTLVEDDYSGLDIDELRFLTYAAYLWAMGSSYSAVAVDGQAMVPAIADETALALQRALPPDQASLATTAIAYWGIGTGNLQAFANFSNIGWVFSDLESFAKELGKNLAKSVWDGIGVGLFMTATLASTIMGILKALCPAFEDDPICRNENALKIASLVVDSWAIVAQAQTAISFLITAIQNYIKHITEPLNKAAATAQAIGMVVGIAVAWVNFGLVLHYSKGNPIAWRVALAQAIVATIYYVVVFAISLIPLVGQVIAAIIGLIDMVLALIFGWLGLPEFSSLVNLIVGMFYGGEVCTSLASAEFGEFSSELREPEGGLVAGNAFLVNLSAGGTITKTNYGENDDLRKSFVESRLVVLMTGKLYPLYDRMFRHTDTSEPRVCEIVNGQLECSNVATMAYTLEARINGLVTFQPYIAYRTVWAETGMYNAWRWKTHLEDGVLPDPAEWDDPSELWLDVLPATPSELWSWTEVSNPDWDGDGLTNEQEELLGTDPTKWDTDGDGLSDYFEWLNADTLGTDPLKFDTDGDGLSDAEELRYGTRIDVADTDGDGLLDGEEVRRLDSDGNWVGGWEVTLPEGITIWVSSDPLQADADGDGLTDAEERANGLSPYAANALVPTLSLGVTPIRGLPGGRVGAYWFPGEEVILTITLDNWADRPVTTTLSLQLPSWLEVSSGGAMQGDRTPPMVTEGNTLTWSFTDSNTLNLYEAVSTTIAANIGATAAKGEIALSLQYGDTQMRKVVSAVVDGGAPDVAIMAPSNGSYLRGTRYVVGGWASDPTTWIRSAELSIVAAGSGPDYHPLPVTQGAWAYGWDLPEDGAYTLQARATDAMLNSATTPPTTVTVDNTPPTVSLNWLMAAGGVHLSGTAADNLSGVERVQLAIAGQPWRTVPLDGASWSYDWLVGENTQGRHAVSARAIDRAGNTSTVVDVEIIVDSVPPASIVTGGADRTVPPAIAAGTTFTLTGVADEGGHLPQPAAPAALRTGMDVFDDSTVWLGLSSIHDNDGGVLAGWIGDFNADRMADLAIGLPGPEGDAGFVAIVYGRAGGWPVPPDLEMLAGSRTRFYGVEGARLGSFLSAAGDVNGDNMADLLIGERDGSRAFLVFGNSGPLGGVTLDSGRTGYRALLQAPGTVQGLAAAGDVNGDGYGDLLITAGGTAYLLLGRKGPWPEMVNIAAEAVATYPDVTGAVGLGDITGDQLADWATIADKRVQLYAGRTEPSMAGIFGSFTSTDAAPRVVALGDVDGDGRDDWIYSDGTDRKLVYGSGGLPHTFTEFDGFFAAPGDVDGDGRAEILLSTAQGIATVLQQQPGSGVPAPFATIAGVAGSANAPFMSGADLTSDGSAELLLIPSREAAEARGFDAPDFSYGFISPQSLPLGAASPSVEGLGTSTLGGQTMGIMALSAELLSTSADTRYVDDDLVCDGNAPCDATIQAAIDAADGGGDAVIVYPGVYAGFHVPAGTAYDHLTVQGVSADAVFVEAPGATAVRIGAEGVRLANLTLRNATTGLRLDDGAGDRVWLDGDRIVLERVVIHSVQVPISTSQAAAMTVRDSTLVGNGAQAIFQVDAEEATGIYSWANDRELTPALSTNGALAGTATTLYAMPGGADRTVYAATPGANGALGPWSAAFQVPHDMPASAGHSAIAAGGSYFYQMHSRIKGVDLTTSNGEIRAIVTAPNGDLYVGGSFSNIGGIVAQNIARWDGSAWYPLGTTANNGVYGTVHAIAFTTNGDAYVGGSFSEAADIRGKGYFYNVARWDGSNWQPLGAAGQLANGTDGPVYGVVAADCDTVLIGGRFDLVRPDATRTNSAVHNFVAYHLTRFPESNGWVHFSSMPVGTMGANGLEAGEIRSMVWSGGRFSDHVPFGKLYVGGTFDAVTGNTYPFYGARNVAVYGWKADGMTDGLTWGPLGSATPAPVTGVAFDPAGGGPYGTVYAVSNHADASGVYQYTCTPFCNWAILPTGETGRGTALAVDAARNVYAAMGAGSLYVMPAGKSAFEEMGSESSTIWTLRSEGSGQVLAGRGISGSGGMRRWMVESLFRRDLAAGTWTFVPYPSDVNGLEPLAGIAADPSGNLYALWQPDTQGNLVPYRLNAGASTWTALMPLEGRTTTRLKFSKVAFSGNFLWAFADEQQSVYRPWVWYAYNVATNRWYGNLLSYFTIDNVIPADDQLSVASQVVDGVSRLYYLRPHTPYPNYEDEKAFFMLTEPGLGKSGSEVLETPTTVNTVQPNAMAAVGNYLYVYGTGNSGVTTNLFRYGPAPDPSLGVTFERTAFVVPDTASIARWANLTYFDGTHRFSTRYADCAWIGSSSAYWVPTLPTGANRMTSTQADFVAPADGLYRVGADSVLAAGYHTYKAVAHVFPSESACTDCGDTLIWGETAFATVREGVESGAARVLIHPGRYPQTFYLVSGVEVIGSGAESTIIEPPAGAARTLVTAEGVSSASLARVTLAGGATWEGFLAEGGAKALKLTRTILRGLKTGIRLRGGAQVEIVNNTLVRNGDGIVAETTTPVNVRNTVLAYHAGTGLSRGSAPTSLSNTYNAFWANGTDMAPEDVSLGSLFVDPRLRDLEAYDLRLAPDSPLIDKGAPNDPAPPGSGERVDIGYAEHNAAGFYVSPSYSATGLNDGLAWGIDAFDRIQPALDAAAAALRGLRGALPEGGYSVAVDRGTYAERVTVPSHVRLVGSGADVTAIDAANDGSAVTFDGVITAELSGFTVRNAGSAGVAIRGTASNILIARNVIRNNAGAGVGLAARASAQVLFNTIVDNEGAGVAATGTGTWVTVRNNIVDGNDYGLQATSGALVRNDYNLLHNTTDLSGVVAGPNTVTADPAFTLTGYYVPTATSPAVDAADPLAPVPLAGGLRADIGYKELIACPLTLAFGPVISSTVTGNSGVAQVEVGVSFVTDAAEPVTATLPASWQVLTPAQSDKPLFYWSHPLSRTEAGLYRVYSRPTDAAGNVEEDPRDWYEGAFVVDDTPPTVAWGSPALPTNTDAAAVLAVAEVAGTVTTGSGTRNDVMGVAFRATGPDGTMSYPGSDGRAWIPLPTTGSYTIEVVAVDEAGHQTSRSATVAVSASSSVATITNYAAGSGVNNTSVSLRGYARFTDPGAGAVAVTVGTTTVQATLDAPGAQFSGWTADITLPAVEGTKTLTVTPSLDSTPGSVTTLNLLLDTTAPALTVAAPAAGTTVTQTVTFSGTVSDTGAPETGSGVAQVEVSVDGGYTWRPAALSDGVWQLAWDLGIRQDSTTYPARVRAIDGAGNVTVVSRPVSVDSMPPTDLAPVTLGTPEGQHLDLGTELAVSWNPPVDAGGTAQVLWTVTQDTDTVPTTPASGTSLTATLDWAGDWYVHLMTQDGAGNQRLYRYGPWHVRDMTNETFSSRRQSIIVDGLIDLAHNEWAETDLLGIDAQGFDTQQLYASWDGEAIYLGWSGAWWTLDGEMWAYFNVAESGSTEVVGGGAMLPFAADIAVSVTSPVTGTLYTWNGTAWVGTGLNFGQGSTGDTEARIAHALGADQAVQMLAFALPPTQAAPMDTLSGADRMMLMADSPGVRPWVIFPNTNPLEGTPTAAYGWDSPDIDEMNVGQPTARTVRFSATTQQPTGAAWCPAAELVYEILLQNPEPTPISGLGLALLASKGLTYQSVTGAFQTSGEIGGNTWALTVPTLAAGESRRIIVTATVGDALSGVESVNTTFRLSAGDTALTGRTETTISHLVDGQAPTVTLHALPGAAIAAGTQTFTGIASDAGAAGGAVSAGACSGVTRVEISTDDGNRWFDADGTQAWSAQVSLPEGTTLVTLQARATDGCGYQSEVAVQTFTVDGVPPVVNWKAPAVVTGTLASIFGTTYDPLPEGGLVQRVEVQLDSETEAWRPAAGLFAPQNGVQGWLWSWITPQEDGVYHRARVRATDLVGNATVTDWQSMLIDTVAPQITTTHRTAIAVLPDDPTNTGSPAPTGGLDVRPGYRVMLPLVLRSSGGQSVPASPQPGAGAAIITAGVQPLLMGTVTDGSGVRAVDIVVHDPSGGVRTFAVSVTDGAWAFEPDLTGWAVGAYTLRVRAVDVYGNLRMAGPYPLDVQDAPILGLTATNNSPRLIGQEVTFGAGVTGGSNVTYAWDFGDGGTADGQGVTYAYAQHGEYTATVTATNSSSTVHATTLVTILALSVEAGDDQTANEGEPITLTATYVDARPDVTHAAAFDWGDGTSTTGDVDGTAFTIMGSHVYGDNGVYTVTVSIDDQRDSTASDTLQVTVGNLPPVVTVQPVSQTVHYSELVTPIIFTATDVASDTLEAVLSWSSDGSDFSPGAPRHLSPDEGACSAGEGIRTCTWTVSGAVLEHAGTYALQLAVTDKDGDVGVSVATLVVVPEETVVDFDSENPVAVQVAAPGGTSGTFTLRACVSERHAASLGDIDLAQVSMSLVPVGPGGTIAGTEPATTAEEGAKCVTFTFSEVPVNTYTVEVTVSGDYYAGSGEDVLVVYDPSLGFTTGGGWFFWPGTDDAETGYRGDRTNFGYTMKYNKAGKNLQGSLLLIRHLEDESIYRVKSNALDGLALGEDGTIPMGWASFSGKCTYQEPGWPEPIGNYTFMVYVEDRDAPGDGTDRFWIEVSGGLSLARPATEHAGEIGGGNIVVPHRAR